MRIESVQRARSFDEAFYVHAWRDDTAAIGESNSRAVVGTKTFAVETALKINHKINETKSRQHFCLQL